MAVLSPEAIAKLAKYAPQVKAAIAATPLAGAGAAAVPALGFGAGALLTQALMQEAGKRGMQFTSGMIPSPELATQVASWLGSAAGKEALMRFEVPQEEPFKIPPFPARKQKKTEALIFPKAPPEETYPTPEGLSTIPPFRGEELIEGRDVWRTPEGWTTVPPFRAEPTKADVEGARAGIGTEFLPSDIEMPSILKVTPSFDWRMQPDPADDSMADKLREDAGFMPSQTNNRIFREAFAGMKANIPDAEIAKHLGVGEGVIREARTKFLDLVLPKVPGGPGMVAPVPKKLTDNQIITMLNLAWKDAGIYKRGKEQPYENIEHARFLFKKLDKGMTSDEALRDIRYKQHGVVSTPGSLLKKQARSLAKMYNDWKEGRLALAEPRVTPAMKTQEVRGIKFKGGVLKEPMVEEKDPAMELGDPAKRWPKSRMPKVPGYKIGGPVDLSQVPQELLEKYNVHMRNEEQTLGAGMISQGGFIVNPDISLRNMLKKVPSIDQILTRSPIRKFKRLTGRGAFRTIILTFIDTFKNKVTTGYWKPEGKKFTARATHGHKAAAKAGFGDVIPFTIRKDIGTTVGSISHAIPNSADMRYAHHKWPTMPSFKEIVKNDAGARDSLIKSALFSWAFRNMDAAQRNVVIQKLPRGKWKFYNIDLDHLTTDTPWDDPTIRLLLEYNNEVNLPKDMKSYIKNLDKPGYIDKIAADLKDPAGYIQASDVDVIKENLNELATKDVVVLKVFGRTLKIKLR